MAHKMPVYWQTAGLNIKQMNEVNKKYFDRKVHPYEIKIGDRVLWCDYSGKSKATCKLQCHWQGPFKILDINDNKTQVCLELKPCDKNGLWYYCYVAM